MKRNPLVFIVILMVFCVSCAKKETGAPFFWQISPDRQLFDRAEKKYQAGSYDDALLLYENYLSQFPDAGQAPAALLKVGMICVYLEQYERAVSAFDQVQALYPESPYAREAGVGKLAVYYKTGDYEQVTVSAGNVLSQALAAEQRVRVNLILGDSYLAIKSPLEAYYAYLSAFGDATENEKGRVISRLKTALALMDESDLTSELAKLEGRPPGGYLMYQLGLNYMEEGFLGDAVTTFSSFIESYPGHENVAQAEEFIAVIEASAVTDRHVIGCLLPLTGKYEKFGHQALEGIEFALARFSRQPGAPVIRLLIKDTASDPLIAQKQLAELADSNAAAIIGPIGTAEYVSTQAQALRIPMIALTQKSGVTEAGDYVFRNFLTPRMQTKTLVNYAAGTLHAKRFAILYPDETYGDLYMNLFWDEVISAGGQVVGVETYDPERTDFADSIKKLVGLYYDIPEDLVEEPSQTPLVYNEGEYPENAEAQPDVSDILTGYDAGNWHDELTESIMIRRQAAALKHAEEEGPDPVIDFDVLFIPDSPNKAGLILPQLAYYDVTHVSLLGTNLWHSDKLIDMAKSHAQGAVLSEGFFEQSSAEHVHQFVTGFKYVYGSTPGFVQAVGYDTAWMLFDLVTRPDIRFRAQIKRGLYAMPPFFGVTGTTSFDSNGEAVKDLYLLKVSGRRFMEITK